MTVAPASRDDAEELVSAFERLIPQLSQSSPPPSLAEVRELLESPTNTQFVARDDIGTIVGVSTLVVFRIPTALRAWIEDVVVDEAAGGQGIGTLLTEAMLEHARSLGCRTVDLTSRPEPRGGEPPLSEGRLRAARHERLPVRVRRVGR